jgi:protein-arginine kinase activator protein McsA
MTEQIKRRGRKPKVVEGQEVNWEKLAKHLQEALETLIKENAAQEAENEKLVRDNLKLIGIVGYLESKIGRANYSV